MASVMTGPAGQAVPEPGPARSGQSSIWTAGLAKSYGSTVALAGLDLHVASGQTVALLGPNGAGKSMTIGLLLGLLSPDCGEVRVYGRSPSQAVADGLIGGQGLLRGRSTARSATFYQAHEVLAFVARLARRIASFPADAVRSAKRVLNELTMPSADAIRADARRFHQLVVSNTAQALTAALFAQGRQTRGPLELNLGDRIGAL